MSSNSTAWSYQRQPDGKDEWLTPPELLESIGVKFDLDPCAPIKRPWPTATNHFTILDNGLAQPWEGRVWCNPPYKDAAAWLKKSADYGNAICLVFARTETKMFFDCVWDKADAVFFIKGRVTFLNVDGSKPKWTSGGPSCLVAYGDCNVDVLENAAETNRLKGKLIYLTK